MIGKRQDITESHPVLEAGEYGWQPLHGGMWYACTPNGLLGRLTAHSVVEHEDGTITVSPSILCTGYDKQWHGYLEAGVWREV